MKKKTILIGILTLILTLTFTSNTFAYRLYPNGNSYSTAPLNKYYWTGDITYGVGGLSTATVIHEIDLAVSRWSNTSNTKVWFTKTSTKTQSILDFEYKFDPTPNLMGLATRYVNNTIINPYTGGDWYWAKIQLNTGFNWKDPDNPYKNPDGTPKPCHLITFTAAHEVGHALGLDHVTSWTEIMDESALPFYFNSIYSPTTADADGVRAIYGPYY